MSQPFKFRYVNEITGVFVLGAILLLIAAIFLAGRAQGIFEPKFTLHTEFTTTEGSFGLQKGAAVRIRGDTAGTVAAIKPSSDTTLTATLIIKESYRRYVRTDSKAFVKKALIITGDAYIDISSGSAAAPQIEDGSMITCLKDTEIIEQAEKLIANLETNTMPILKQLKVVLDETAPLAVQARATLRQGETVLRENVPAALTQAQDSMRAAQVTLEALQRHWLLRKYVEQPDNLGPIAPAAINFPERESNPGESK